MYWHVNVRSLLRQGTIEATQQPTLPVHHDMACVQKLTFDVQHGDVIIMGTDGLLDNVFNTRASKLVWDAKARGATPGVAAQQLATFASARARDPVYLSPFAKQVCFLLEAASAAPALFCALGCRLLSSRLDVSQRSRATTLW